MYPNYPCNRLSERTFFSKTACTITDTSFFPGFQSTNIIQAQLKIQNNMLTIKSINTKNDHKAIHPPIGPVRSCYTFLSTAGATLSRSTWPSSGTESYQSTKKYCFSPYLAHRVSHSYVLLNCLFLLNKCSDHCIIWPNFFYYM